MAQPPSKESEAEIARLMALQLTSPSKFQILGIDWQTATAEIVKNKFKKLVILLHPDKVSHPKAADAFAMVNGAYKLLGNDLLLKRAREAEEKKFGVSGTARAVPLPSAAAGTSASEEEEKKKREAAAKKKIEEDYLAAVRDQETREKRREREEEAVKEKAKEKEDIMFHAQQWKNLGLGGGLKKPAPPGK